MTYDPPSMTLIKFKYDTFVPVWMSYYIITCTCMYTVTIYTDWSNTICVKIDCQLNSLYLNKLTRKVQFGCNLKLNTSWIASYIPTSLLLFRKLQYTVHNDKGKISPCFIFALIALWPEGEFKTGLIELYVKEYVRKLESRRFSLRFV